MGLHDIFMVGSYAVPGAGASKALLDTASTIAGPGGTAVGSTAQPCGAPPASLGSGLFADKGERRS
jgi:hypothetical protein